VNINVFAGAILFSLASLSGAHAQQGAFLEIPPGFFSALRGAPASDSFLGVYLAEVGPDTVQQLDLKEEYGAHISEVIDDSPASEAGLAADDVIVGWNGTRVESSKQLKRMVSETPPGRTVKLDVVREGDARTLDVEIGQHGGMDSPRGMPMPQTPWQHPPVDDWTPPPSTSLWRTGEHKAKMGVLLQGLTEQLGSYFGLEDRSGALIVEVLEDSIAQAAGLQAGDVIIEIDGVQIETPGEVQRTVAELDGDARVKIVRDREEQTLDLQFPEQEEDVRERVIPADDEEAEDDAPRFPGSAM
jgi:serine protease Do